MVGVLIAGVYQVLVTNQRIETSREARWAGADSIQVALDLLAQELRGVSPSEGDLTVLESHAVAFRAPGAFGITCGVVSRDPLTISIALEGRPFRAGDAVFVYADSGRGEAARWVSTSVERVVGRTTCGAQGTSAQDLRLSGSGSGAWPGAVGVGAFVRAWEEVSYAVDAVDGAPYLVRDRAGRRMPLVGPLVPGNGLELTYLDETGAPTNDPGRVTTARIVLRAVRRIGRTSPPTDSVSTVVFLRN